MKEIMNINLQNKNLIAILVAHLFLLTVIIFLGS